MGIDRIGVVGGGQMGAGIAEVAATAGCEVVVRSRTRDGADAVLAAIDRSLTRQVDKGKLDDEARRVTLGRLRPVTDLAELAECDLVSESIVEDLDAKRALFAELDRICSPATILATNTSTLSVVHLAMSTDRPELVCGIHFFNPARTMSLVEIARAITTAESTIVAARAFVERCGKTPVLVKDQAGFVVNALLFPYLNHAVQLFDAGVASRDDIDIAMKGGCNFPMGPLELLDLVGLDTSTASDAPAPLLRRMVGAGQLGRKCGSGFYDYGK